MNLKTLSMCLGLLVAAMISSWIFNFFVMQASFTYDDYGAVLDSHDQTWLPSHIPASSINIKEYQDFDSGALRASFEYDVNDVSSVENACVKVIDLSYATKFVCPPFESRTSTIILGNDGQASYYSYASQLQCLDAPPCGGDTFKEIVK